MSRVLYAVSLEGDRRSDIGLVRVADDLTTPGAPITIANSDPALGDHVWARGWGSVPNSSPAQEAPALVASGQPWAHQLLAPIAYHYQGGSAQRAGDSGGGVFNDRGELVAVTVVGSGEGNTIGVGESTVTHREWIEKVKRDYAGVTTSENAVAVDSPNDLVTVPLWVPEPVVPEEPVEPNDPVYLPFRLSSTSSSVLSSSRLFSSELS